MYDPLDPRDVLTDELEQRKQSGFDLGDLERTVLDALAGGEALDDGEVAQLVGRMEGCQRRRDWPFNEIDAAREIAGAAPYAVPRDIDPASALTDRLAGAWLGRCIGCLFGKPIEGWTAPQVRRYLVEAGAWPLDDYIPPLDPHPAWAPAFKPSWTEATRGRIAGMARDDDLDYAVLGVLVIEQTDGEPTAGRIADEWLRRLSLAQVYTAERAAYRNLQLGDRPPASATRQNPYREWIGALIRADASAYAAPGDPGRAARLAAEDASISHTGNGVAASMWAAALISLALAGVEPAESVPEASRFVPAGTRLDRALRLVTDLHAAGLSWDEVQPKIADATRNYAWVHAIPNATIIAASLLWGSGEFTRSIGLAMSAGHDTDSNGATVGSATGALVGASALPRHLVEPLHDTLRTSLHGIGTVRISEMAARSERLARAGLGRPAPTSARPG